MSDSAFAALGIRASLVAATAEAGYDAPNALQRAVVPVIRRGGNVLLRAASGSGVTMAWASGLLDSLRAPESSSLTGLVIVSTDERADVVADFLARLLSHAEKHIREAEGAGTGMLRVGAIARGWARARSAHLLVATPDAIARAVGSAELKLDQVRALVLEELAGLIELTGEAVMHALMVSVPDSAQRIVTSLEETPEVERFVEGHVKRALRFPARGGASGPGGVLSYLVVRDQAKIDALASVLARPREAPPIVWLRTASRVESVRNGLMLRGHHADGEDAVLVSGELPPEGTRIAGDVPFDREGLTRLDPEHGLVVVRARELAHLRALPRDTSRELRAVGRERPARDTLSAFHAQIRLAWQEEDLPLHVNALEPLFQERSAEEVAAALSAMLRRRTAAPRMDTASPTAPPSWMRLYISSGRRDGIRPSDLVGAITGEAQIAGDRVGRIEIRDKFSVVEVEAETAERVIRALNGTTMKGRALRVDYDRPARTGTPQRRRSPGGA